MLETERDLQAVIDRINGRVQALHALLVTLDRSGCE